jgi:hypothetical protein
MALIDPPSSEPNIPGAQTSLRNLPYAREHKALAFIRSAGRAAVPCNKFPPRHPSPRPRQSRANYTPPVAYDVRDVHQGQTACKALRPSAPSIRGPAARATPSPWRRPSAPASSSRPRTSRSPRLHQRLQPRRPRFGLRISGEPAEVGAVVRPVHGRPGRLRVRVRRRKHQRRPAGLGAAGRRGRRRGARGAADAAGAGAGGGGDRQLHCARRPLRLLQGRLLALGRGQRGGQPRGHGVAGRLGRGAGGALLAVPELVGRWLGRQGLPEDRAGRGRVRDRVELGPGGGPAARPRRVPGHPLFRGGDDAQGLHVPVPLRADRAHVRRLRPRLPQRRRGRRQVHPVRPVGFYGRLCEGGYRLAPLESCALDPTGYIAITFSFGGDVLPPTQSSFIGVYQLTENGPFKYLATASVCGSTYDSSKNGGLCPSSGTLKISRPAVPGRYKIAIAQYSPLDSRGFQG